MSKTAMVVFGLLLAACLWDFFVVMQSGDDSQTVSQVITDATSRSHLLSFGCGVLVCHFFGWMMFPKRG